MEQLKSIAGKPITKATAIFVKDEDGHDYCIHEDDEDSFYKLCSEGYASDDFTEFEKYFSPIGMAPNYYRKNYLK